MDISRAKEIIAVVYPAFMIPAMAFMLIQVYEINARDKVQTATVIQHERRLVVIEKKIYDHLIGHNRPADSPIPIMAPLVSGKPKELEVINED